MSSRTEVWFFGDQLYSPSKGAGLPVTIFYLPLMHARVWCRATNFCTVIGLWRRRFLGGDSPSAGLYSALYFVGIGRPLSKML